jgi:hypothetical protein
MKRDLPPVHPGEILLEDFLRPMKITQYRLAKSIGVQKQLRQLRGITGNYGDSILNYFYKLRGQYTLNYWDSILNYF